MAFEVEAIAKWFDLFSIVDTSIWSSSSINTLNVDGDSTSSFHQGQLWTKRKFLEILYIKIRNVIILNCEKWKFCFADRAFSCQPNFLFPHCLSCNGSFIITSVSLKEDPDTNWKFGHFMSTENLRGLFEPSVALCQNYGIMICGSTWSKFWVRDHHVVSELWNWKR